MTNPWAGQKLSEADIIAIVGAGGYSLKQLAEATGLSPYKLNKYYVEPYAPKDKIKLPGQPRQKPVAVPSPVVAAPVAAVAKPKPQLIQIANALVIGLAGLVLGGVGMFFNVQYWYAFGGVAFGVMGGAIDAVTIFLASNLSWRWSHAPLFAIWLLCAGLSTIAAMGFAANNIGDGLQGRDKLYLRSEAIKLELAQIAADRSQIKSPLELERDIQEARKNVPRERLASSKDCTPSEITTSFQVCDQLVQLRKAKKTAEDGIEKLDKRQEPLAKELAALPPVAGKDPGADHISRITFGLVGSDMVENFRVVGFAFMPSLAGFLMAFARGSRS